MNLKPIPKKYLIHTVALKNKRQGTNADEPEYNETILKNVRVETRETLKYTKENRMLIFAAMLFIDAKNSTMPEIINHGDDIIFDGKTYSIQSVSKIYTFDGSCFHHLEVGLV